MTELPDGWSWATIGEVCEKPKYGWTTSASDIGEVKLLRTTDLTHGPITWETVPFCKEPPKTVVDYLVHPNDVFISRAGSVGVSVLVKDAPYKSVFASYLIRIRPTKKIDAKYLSLFLQSPHYWDQVTELSSGIALANINATKIQSMTLPLPPIDEQHKIVELLEDHLSRLDAALADVKQARLMANQFKVAFLRKVFSGDTNWNSVPMKKLGVWVGGGTPSKANEKFWTDGTVPWLSPKDMGPLEITETADKITEEACLNSTVKKIPENSIVFVVRSGILERKLPIALTKVETTLNQDMKALTFSDEVYPKFGFYAMLGFEQDILRNCRKSGTTVASINTESLMNYEIKVPSLQVQAEILGYVESQLTLIDNSMPHVESILKVGNSFRRSLLQAAFTGQLTKEVASV